MSEELSRDRRRFLAIAAMIIAAAQLSMTGSVSAQSSSPKPANQPTIQAQPMAPAAIRLSIEGELPSFGSAAAWLNSPPLNASGLRGKVVLVEFWTYSCINWLRSFPYVRAWAEKYKDRGLVV